MIQNIIIDWVVLLKKSKFNLKNRCLLTQNSFLKSCSNDFIFDSKRLHQSKKPYSPYFFLHIAMRHKSPIIKIIQTPFNPG